MNENNRGALRIQAGAVPRAGKGGWDNRSQTCRPSRSRCLWRKPLQVRNPNSHNGVTNKHLQNSSLPTTCFPTQTSSCVSTLQKGEAGQTLPPQILEIRKGAPEPRSRAGGGLAGAWTSAPTPEPTRGPKAPGGAGHFLCPPAWVRSQDAKGVQHRPRGRAPNFRAP